MGLCSSKMKKEEDERLPFKFSIPISQTYSADELRASRDFEHDDENSRYRSDRTFKSETTSNGDPARRADEQLLTGKVLGQLGGERKVMIIKDFVLGKYYDKKVDLWYRTVYVRETDSIRKQLLALHCFDMRKVNQVQFDSWCDSKGYPDTKKFYKYFQLLDYMPFSRMLLGLAHKYEVRMHMTDIFHYKGRGPLRAITCYGRQSALVDRALNEYEYRLGKRVTVPHYSKHWDNFIFPDPLVDIADHSLEYPFKWLRRWKPNPPFVPYYPYNVERPLPAGLIDQMDNDMLIPSHQSSMNNDAAIETRKVNTLISMKFSRLESGNIKSLTHSSGDAETKVTPTMLKNFFQTAY